MYKTNNPNRTFILSRSGKLRRLINAAGVLTLASASNAVVSQERLPELDAPIQEEVLITGYRGALLSSTQAKRNSVGFRDEVFADDLGKMPSQNLAESLSRIPGVRINREVTGEGQQISVRGLGPQYTKVVLNGNSINIASTGDINSTTNGRQVDLDIFPTELFTSLAVSKTATARQVEGGVTGYVNMRTLRPSDMGEGHSARFSFEENYRSSNGSFSPKGSLAYSYSGETFGALVAVVANKMDRNVDGYETVGNLAQYGCLITDQPGSNDCRSGGNQTFRFTDVASADYAAAHEGVEVGDAINIYQSAGLSEEQLTSVGMPYIGRFMTLQGEKGSTSGLVSLQFTPNEDLEFALDMMRATSNNEFVRTEVMHFYRRNYTTPYIPADFSAVDSGNGLRLQSGTFYGNRPWIGSRDYNEELEFTSVMPSMEWQINETWKLYVSASKTDSNFVRDNPYGLFYAAEGTMTYNNDGDVPTVHHNAFDDFENYDWDSFRTGHNERETNTTGFHGDIRWGEDATINGIIVGVAYDEMEATQKTYGVGSGNSDNYLAAHGLDYVQEAFGDYLRPVTMGANIDDYRGFTRVGDLDWHEFKAAIDYDGIGMVATSLTNISEKATAAFIEGNIELDVYGHTLRANAGVRYVTTDQFVSTDLGETNEEYNNTLPSLSAMFDVTESIKVRASASRSLSRANPADMYPSSKWDGSGIDKVVTGNPALEPFISDNIDIGGEWYFSDLGYIGLTYFTKDVTGFTRTVASPENLSDLGQWGIDLDNLTDTQTAARAICEPNCLVTVETKENIDGETSVDGWELIWVQPLDVLVEGLGFNASATAIDAENENGDEIGGVSDSYNATAYYENDTFQARLTYYYQDGGYAFESWGATVTNKDRAQVDFAASYRLPVLQDYDLMLTFDAYNLTNAALINYAELDRGQTFNAYYPGAVYTLGISGSF